MLITKMNILKNINKIIDILFLYYLRKNDLNKLLISFNKIFYLEI